MLVPKSVGLVIVVVSPPFPLIKVTLLRVFDVKEQLVGVDAVKVSCVRVIPLETIKVATLDSVKEAFGQLFVRVTLTGLVAGEAEPWTTKIIEALDIVAPATRCNVYAHPKTSVHNARNVSAARFGMVNVRGAELGQVAITTLVPAEIVAPTKHEAAPVIVWVHWLFKHD